MRPIESTHFTVEKISAGAYAALHREGGWGIANAGFVDLGDTTVVFDTTLTPEAARDLKEIAEGVTGNAVSKVINSHFHNDHIWGNQVFEPQADIISSVETRRLIQTGGKDEYQWYRDQSASQLKTLEQEFEKEKDPTQRSAIHVWITYYQTLVESMPSLKVCLPNLVFSEGMQIIGSTRAVELITFQNAHTGSDTILYVPSEKVIFMSDLLFVRCHPYLVEGDVYALSSALARIMDLDAEIFVPGHGPVGTLQDVRLMMDYIDTCVQMAKKLFEQHPNGVDFPAVKIPDPFQAWQLPAFFESNVRALHQGMVQQSEG
jgi:glyoxylase-like metal-dependent hydrolase (beta-lactamase superfamily II)